LLAIYNKRIITKIIAITDIIISAILPSIENLGPLSNKKKKIADSQKFDPLRVKVPFYINRLS
jgi:hypothetical protein